MGLLSKVNVLLQYRLLYGPCIVEIDLTLFSNKVYLKCANNFVNLTVVVHCFVNEVIYQRYHKVLQTITQIVNVL